LKGTNYTTKLEKLNTQNNIELIEKYLDNQLDESEVEGLNAQLKTDADFFDFFDTEKILINSIQDQAKEAIKVQLDSFHEEIIIEEGEVADSDVENIAFELEYNLAELFDKLNTFTSNVNGI